MKKRIISFFAMLLCSVAVLAQEFEVDGIKYNVTSTTDPLTVGVISNDPGYSGDIVIPQKVQYNNEEYTVTSIGSWAFYFCSDLTSITIPNSVTSIGSLAFCACMSLTAITIPSSVTSIENSTFSGCRGLTSITIPSSVTSIGSQAFQSCSSLTSITIPSSVTSIENSTFSGCSGLTTITIPNSVTSIGSNAFDGCSGLTSITIPSSVTSIENSTFSGCSGLTTITIPNSVTSIGTSAFNGCSSLTAIVVEAGNTVYDSRNDCNAIIKTETNELIAGCKNTVIPSSVTSIGSQAFQSCSSLTSITIPSSVTSIENSTFSGCSGLTTITIPNSVTSIGTSAFNGCSSLTSIVVEAGNTVYDSRNDCNAIIKTETNELIAGCKNTVIPSSVTSIGTLAFYDCSGLTSITIPSSVTSIGGNAFEGCSGLTSITIPSSVTSIGDWAFEWCSGLTSVVVGATTPIAIHESCFPNRENATLYVPHGSKAAYDDAESWKDFNMIEEMFTGTVTDGLGVKYTENNDFTCYVSGHEDSYDACIVIPNRFHGRIVSSIGGNAFEDCSSLTSISIPNSVTSIGSNAFSGCNNLTSVTVISETPVEVTNNVFSNRENATLYVLAGSVDDYQTADYWKDFNIEELFTGTVADEQGVRYTATSNGSCSVSGHEDHLNASIVIPKIVQGRTVTSIEYIEYYAYGGCSGLTSITIPSSVTSIRGGAFSVCSGLTSIVVETGNTVYDSRNNCNAIVETATNELIAGCQNTIIPSSVTSIGVGAFGGCSGLTSITIPSSVTSIGDAAFKNCSGLTSITIPSSVTSIGGQAFWGCSGLTSITIPSSVTSIEDYTFNRCSGLTSITIPSSVTSIGRCAFEYCSGLTAITIPSSVTSIGDNAFCECSSLTAITIPNSVTSIEQGAFEGCSGLNSIVVETGNTVYDSRNNCNAIVETATNELIAGCQNTIIPSSVTSIGVVAFYGCSGLTAITIPSSVTSIGGTAFCECSSLTAITIPSSVTSIGTFAFTNCSGLTSITIPSSVTSIGGGTFWGCSGLTAITIPSSVTSIGDNAFCECSSLTAITIPSSVTSIGDNAFSGCSGLTSITIPSSVTSIGGGTFWGCSGLTSITIPSSVTSIGGGTFWGCSGLTSITIPSSVTSIGDWAFERCSGLTSVVVGATTPIAINSSCFTNRANATLYVPKGSKAAYEAADYWKEFKEIIELGPEPISITMATSSGTAREMKGYSCAYGLDFNGIEDVKAYIAVGFSQDHTVYLSRVRVVPPNTGIVLKTTKPGITVEVPTTDEDAYWVNMLLPALSNVTVNPTETVDNVEYRNLMVGMITATNKMGFVEFSSPVVRSNNCYLRVPASFYNSSASARMRRALDMVFDDDGTTDIHSIEDHYIVEQESSDDNQVYDLQGRKVTTPRNGLVIKNGKLIFVKP